MICRPLKEICLLSISCGGWSANDSVEAKWIWIARHFNHRCCNFLNYITSLSLGGHDAGWQAQHSGSSPAVHGSGVPMAHPHSLRLERWAGSLVQALGVPPPPQYIFCTICLPFKCPQLQDWAATGPHWWSAPSSQTITACFAAPLLELTICFFGHFWTCLHCCSGHVVDHTWPTSTTARSYLKFMGLH